MENNGNTLVRLRAPTTFLLVILMFLGLILLLLSTNNNFKLKGNTEKRFKRSRPWPLSMDDGDKIVCRSAACMKQLDDILSAVDPSVDPCDDFYQYACGRWNHSFTNSEENNSISFVRMQKEIHLNLKEILEEPIEVLESEAEKNAKLYYHSCRLSQKKTGIAGPDKTLLDILHLIVRLPADEQFSDAYFKKKEWNFQDALQTVQNFLNVGVFFDWTVKLVQTENLNLIKLSHSGLTFPVLSYSRKDDGIALTSMFRDKINEVVSLFLDASDKTTHIDQEISAIQNMLDLKSLIEVENKIARITPSYESESEKYLHYLTVAELNALAPFIDWVKFFQSAFSEVNIAITSSQRVAVSSRAFFQNLSILVEELLAYKKGKAMLRSYLFWHTTSHFFQTWKKSFNIAQETDFEKDCITDTANAMPLALQAMLIKRRFYSEPSNKKLAETMFESIKEIYLEENLNSVDLLDDEIRILLRDKVTSGSSRIGYPEFILNASKLDQFYGGLNFNSSEYFMNSFRLERFLFHKKLIKLNQPIDKNEWTGAAPFDTFPYTLKMRMNQIVIPSGILHPPFFDATFPHAINFGSIGFIIGHELEHGFDNGGLKLDGNGNYLLLWERPIIKRFEIRSDCLVQQYSTYTVNELTIDGKLTINENIADNGGLNVAYKAYLKWDDNHQEIVIPYDVGKIGMQHLTDKQLFFLSFAQNWCASETGYEGILPEHSPYRLRVNGPIINMPDAAFSSAFDCPAGSAMNPKKKCEIW